MLQILAVAIAQSKASKKKYKKDNELNKVIRQRILTIAKHLNLVDY